MFLSYLVAGLANGLELSVRPWMVSRHSMLAKVEDVNNAVFLVGDRLGTQMFYGRGAGGDATGAAVVSDLVEIARDLAAEGLSASQQATVSSPGEGLNIDSAQPEQQHLLKGARRDEE